MTMQYAKAFWTTGAEESEIRTMELAPLQQGQALVRTLYSAISHGTEMLVYRGLVPKSEALRMRAPFQEGEFSAPLKYGYINVGEVIEGPALWRGKKVFCLYPHQTQYIVDIDALTILPGELEPRRAVLAAGMETAINGLWDASPQVGDRVTVVGAGVIGSLCAYLVSKIPGISVRIVDVNIRRRELAQALGIDFCLPSDITEEKSDIVIHATGQGQGLQTCLEIAGKEARIVDLSWYGEGEVHLRLGGAFHAQRLQIISSQVGTIPAHQQARWDYSRRIRLALKLILESGANLDVLFEKDCEFNELPPLFAEMAKRGGGLCQRVRY